jgi:subtilase family serine protease
MTNNLKASLFFIAGLLVNGLGVAAMGQGPLNRVAARIDEEQVVTLTGNVHPGARREFDQGAVSETTRLNRMVLKLEPSAAQQADLDALIEAQHDPQSPLYHKWLTPADYGSRFGASTQDLARITAWLNAHGFTVDEIPANNRLVIFSGTVGQLAETFHTEIHSYIVNGVQHIANSQDPQIPAALEGVVGGVVSLHDFRRSPQIHSRTAIGAAGTRAGMTALPEYSSGGTNYLFPADWATIYDLKSLYSAGTTGTGTSIAIVGRSNINISDVTQFRSASGLVANNPTVILVSTNPGLLSGDQDESTLDVEWSGAVAPGAAVKFVVGASTTTSDGVDLSAQYIVNHAVAQVVSTSYGSCEQDMGATELAFYNSLWQQAASQGMSSFVSSGDSGAAGCYGGSSTSASGTGVNGLCSSPYSTCVGGTEFNEGANSSKYWGTTNASTDGSALSYIPEEVWNESALNGGSGLWSSGGGVSTVYPQPSWQKGVSGTSAANGMRAVPDVAMAAAGHDGYIIVEDGSFWVISGTSAASPSFAGVVALLVQSQNGKGVGNANTGLYPLLNATHNPFHATPSGNNSVPGVTGFTASGAPYNLATGLGSVDGALLVSSWGSGGSGTTTDFALTASTTSGTVLVGKSATLSLNVTESGTAKNKVTLTAQAPTGVTVGFNPTSILPGTASTVTVTVGSTATTGLHNITITGADTTGSQNLTYALTVTPLPTLALTAASSTVAVTQGTANTVSLTATTGGSYTGSISYTISGLPTGVTAGWSVNPTGSVSGTSTTNETLTLTASAAATVGSATLVINASGDGLTSAQNVTLQVLSAAGVQLSVAPASVSVQSLSTTTVLVTATPTGGMVVQTGAAGATISVASGLPKGFTTTWSAPAVNSSGAVVWTLTLTGSSTAAAGSSTLSLSAKVLSKTGTAYTVNQTLPMTVTLTPPTLAMTPVSTSLSIVQGSTLTDVVSLAGNATYSGAVTLSVSGLPAGVTASWSSNSVTLNAESGASTLTLTASSSATVGAATVTITASGDGLTATKQVALQVQYAPAVLISASPTTVSVPSLSSATVTVTATPVGGVVIPAGATGSTISVAAGLPKGFTATWSAPAVNSAGAVVWTLTLTGSTAATAGTSTLNLSAKVLAKTGTAYILSQTLPMTVTLIPPTLTVTPASTNLSMIQGSAVTDVVSLAGNATYSGAVSLSVSGLPAGVTASWSSNPVTLNAESGTSTLTLTASSSATVGAATVTVSATGDGITASQKLTLTVVGITPTLAVTSASSSMTVINPMEAISPTQSTASQVFTFAGGGSFHGTVALSVTGLPANLTATWSSNPVTLNSVNSGSSTLTITAVAATASGGLTTVAPGTYNIVVTATGDGLTVAKTIQVQVAGLVVTPTVTALTIHRGKTGTFSITTTPVGGASGVVAPGLAANASPSGISVTANPGTLPAPGGGTITFTFTVSSTAALTTYQLYPTAILLPSMTATTPTLLGLPSGTVTLTILQ